MYCTIYTYMCVCRLLGSCQWAFCIVCSLSAIKEFETIFRNTKDLQWAVCALCPFRSRTAAEWLKREIENSHTTYRFSHLNKCADALCSMDECVYWCRIVGKDCDAGRLHHVVHSSFFANLHCDAPGNTKWQTHIWWSGWVQLCWGANKMPNFIWFV